MNQKHCLLVMAFAGVLSLAPLPAFSGNLSNFSDALEQLADMTRAADRAHNALNDAMQGGRDYSPLPGNTRSIRVGSDTGSLATITIGISGRACPPDLPRREGFRPDRRKSSKNTTTRNIEIEKRPFR